MKILYVGYSAELYAEFFLPEHFAAEIDVIDWPRAIETISSIEVKDSVRTRVASGKYDALVLAADHDPLFYFSEIQEMAKRLPVVGVFGDDVNMPNYSSQLAMACDWILTTDPLQIGRYLTLGVQASTHLFDISSRRYPDLNLERDIDVLVYGALQKVGRDDISWLHSFVGDKNLVDISGKFVPFEELVSLLNRARLTINWNGPWKERLLNNFDDPLGPYYSQLKGRVFEALLCGCLPLSTVNFSQDIIFAGKLPTFDCRAELHALLTFYLEDEEARIARTQALRDLAVSHISSFKRIDVAVLPRRLPLPSVVAPDVDTVVATRRLLEWLRRLKLYQWSFFFRDVRGVRFTSVRWRFVIAQLKMRIGTRD